MADKVRSEDTHRDTRTHTHTHTHTHRDTRTDPHTQTHARHKCLLAAAYHDAGALMVTV